MYCMVLDLRRRFISIHALREEGDVAYRAVFRCRSISIHALREEGDDEPLPQILRTAQFLSTPSARRATALCAMSIILILFLSTPSARRATGRGIPICSP